MGALVEARQHAETIIAALIPTEMPTARWTRAPRHLPLEEMPLASTPSANQRRFQVRAVPTYQAAGDNVYIGLADGGLEVLVLYEVGGQDAAVTIADLTATDCVQLSVALRHATWPAGVVLVELEGEPVITQRGDGDGVWVMRLELRIVFEVDGFG